MISSGRFISLLLVLIVAGVLVNSWSYLGEARLERKELRGFPRQLGTWGQVGGDQTFDVATLSVLGASDYVMRNYASAEGTVANFYVGYYASQRDGKSYHSPLNCLPGSGWQMNSPGEITISPANGAPSFVANRYVIQNGERKELLVYWYQGRGRAIASEYWGKIYTVIDSVRLRRSDAAMVRVMVPMGNSEPSAIQAAADFASQASIVLPEFVPN